MEWRRVRSILLISSCLCGTKAFDVERRPASFPRQPPQPSMGVEPPQQAVQPHVVGKVSNLVQRYRGFIAATSKVSRGISMACGLWLIAGTPIALIKSGLYLRPGDAVMTVYLATFGLLMFVVELPFPPQLQKLLQTYLLFMYTRWGRCYFLVLTAATTWTVGQVGVLTKAMVVSSAALSTYVMFSSSRFQHSDDKAEKIIKGTGEDLQKSGDNAWSMLKMFGVGKVFAPAAQPAAAGFGVGRAAGDSESMPWPSSG